MGSVWLRNSVRGGDRPGARRPRRQGHRRAERLLGGAGDDLGAALERPGDRDDGGRGAHRHADRDRRRRADRRRDRRPHRLLWAVLPFAVLLGAYSPRAISFTAGQAGFTVVIVDPLQPAEPGRLVGRAWCGSRTSRSAARSASSPASSSGRAGAADVLREAIGGAYETAARYLDQTIATMLGSRARGADRAARDRSLRSGAAPRRDGARVPRRERLGAPRPRRAWRGWSAARRRVRRVARLMHDATAIAPLAPLDRHAPPGSPRPAGPSTTEWRARRDWFEGFGRAIAAGEEPPAPEAKAPQRTEGPTSRLNRDLGPMVVLDGDRGERHPARPRDRLGRAPPRRPARARAAAERGRPRRPRRLRPPRPRRSPPGHRRPRRGLTPRARSRSPPGARSQKPSVSEEKCERTTLGGRDSGLRRTQRRDHAVTTTRGSRAGGRAATSTCRGCARAGCAAASSPSSPPRPGEDGRRRPSASTRATGRYTEPLAPSRSPTRSPPPTSTAAAGRLFALERAGELTVARTIADVDARPRRRRAAGRRPRHGGRRGDRPGPRIAARLARDGTALPRPGLEPRQRLRHRRPVRLPLLAGHRPRPHRRRRRPGPGLRRARHPRRPQPHERDAASGTSPSSRPGRWSPATPAPTPSPPPRATSPTRQLDAIARRPAAWSGSSTPPSSSAPTSPTIPTRRCRRSPTTPATSPTGSASSTSASAPTSTAPRSPPRSATSPACRSSSTPSAPSASASRSSKRSPGTTGAASSTPGGTDPAVDGPKTPDIAGVFGPSTGVVSRVGRPGGSRAGGARSRPGRRRRASGRCRGGRGPRRPGRRRAGARRGSTGR